MQIKALSCFKIDFQKSYNDEKMITIKMKKTFLLLAILATLNILVAQQKTTGTVVLGTMSLKIDLDQTTSLATYTMRGPSTKWFSVGFGTTSMTPNTDCITYGTSLLDRHIVNSHSAPEDDVINNLTLVSNTVVASNRTVVATRPFNTADTDDFSFAFSLDNLNIIWAVGSSTNVSAQHATFGFTNLTFTPLLGLENFSTLTNLNVYPNPSNGIFTVSKNSLNKISNIKIFDFNAKLITEVYPINNNQDILVDLSKLAKGTYFMEVSNGKDKAVRKVIIN